MSLEVDKVFEFEAAHRLVQNKGRQSNIHGHSFRAIVHFVGERKSTSGKVVDFADFKKIGDWIFSNWEHALLISSLDGDLLEFCIEHNLKYYSFSAQDPTAENMACALFFKVNEFLNAYIKEAPGLFTGVKLELVEIHETGDTSASYSLPG
jgi:6-pyruvoyltetrahydropterin/6-carboxytetrahydropterin synthase